MSDMCNEYTPQRNEEEVRSLFVREHTDVKVRYENRINKYHVRLKGNSLSISTMRNLQSHSYHISNLIADLDESEIQLQLTQGGYIIAKLENIFPHAKITDMDIFLSVTLNDQNVISEGTVDALHHENLEIVRLDRTPQGKLQITLVRYGKQDEYYRLMTKNS